MEITRGFQMKGGKQHIRKFKTDFLSLVYEDKTFCGKKLENVEVVSVSFLEHIVNRVWYFITSDIDTLDTEKTCKTCIKLMVTGKPI